MTVRIFIAAVEAEMHAAIARTPIAAPAIDLLDAGGKRLRARLLWWAANAAAPAPVDPEHDMLIRAAAAIELAHLGSLVHDDIVDCADTRRGVATVHRRHGVRVATDAGAALAHLANEFVAALGRPARRAVRRSLLATCRGQVRELAASFVLLSPHARLAIMREKTGAFFELAATLGAHVAGANVRARASVARYARRFGVAFQIADDVLDVAGDPEVLGRANGADLRYGVVTLPVLLAADPGGALRHGLGRLRRWRDATVVAACADRVFAGGGVLAASAVARWWLERALDALATLPRSDAVSELVVLAHTSVERGLRPGTPCFAGSPDAAAGASLADVPLVDPPRPGAIDEAAPIDPALQRILDWFHPGLAAMVATRAGGGTIRARRAILRCALEHRESWSQRAHVAADAIALAHALAEDEALRGNPVRTLACVDALHCAAIALLADADDADEHQRLAALASALAPRPSLATTAARPCGDTHPALAALPT